MKHPLTIFAVNSTTDIGHCCDLCNPRLFDGVRPRPAPPKPRAPTVKKHPADNNIRQALLRWRREVKHTHFPGQMWPSAGLLDGDSIELLASITPVVNIQRLQKLMGGWKWWDKLGPRLYECLCESEAESSRLTQLPPTTASSSRPPHTESVLKRARAPSAPSPAGVHPPTLSSTASPMKRTRMAPAAPDHTHADSSSHRIGIYLHLSRFLDLTCA